MALVLFIVLLASAASYKPAPPLKCGANEYAVPCKTICPPQYCNISYTDYVCDPHSTCIPGCDCVNYHLRTDENICVHNETCPSPPTSCSGSNSTATCDRQTSSGQSENNARESSFNSSSNVFISSQSSESTSVSSSFSNNVTVENEENRECTYNRCTPTCSLPYPQYCPQDSNPCNCSSGMIISEEGGKCVPREECPNYINCNGDYNASHTNCPIACPSTCDKPDAEYCNVTCGSFGCACNPGHLLTQINGKCIKPEECPGGNACAQNETFVDCLIKCPNIYCPVDDNRDNVICETGHRCPSGCSCQKNYRRKSVDEYICIHASDCPPVNCTRPNEEWNSCPEPCFSDYCSEKHKVSKPGDCPYSGLDCRPKCICKHGFFRNATDICVPAPECPPDNLKS